MASKLLGFLGIGLSLGLAAGPASARGDAAWLAPFAQDACGVKRLVGDAGLFNLYVYDYARHAQTDTEGRIAIGGGADGNAISYLSNYRIGAKLPLGNRLTLLLDGLLSFEHGTIEPANVVWGRHFPAIAETVYVHGSQYQAPSRQGLTRWFDATRRELEALADRLAAIEPLSSQLEPVSVIELNAEGVAAGVAVFHVGADVLARGNGTGLIKLRAPAETLVVINVDGRDVALESLGFSYAGGVEARNVVLNFHEAESLTLSAIGVQGTVLAPRARVAFTNGVVHGSLLALSLDGDGQLNNAFTECQDGATVAGLFAKIGW